MQQLGRVVKWIPEAGYGFIKPDGTGRDIYFHANTCVVGDDIREGERVEFDTGICPIRGKPEALNVQPLRK